MKSLYIVDVFTERRYSGNQLAVVVTDESLPTEEMQAVAAEMNFSETTFVAPAPQGDGSFPLRIFTPVEELPFAGHPTLGTAAVLSREVVGQPGGQVVLETGVGKITVTLGEDPKADLLATMRPPLPEIERTFSGDERAWLANLAGLTENDLDPDHSPCALRIGIGMILLPLRDGEALGRAALDLAGWRAAAEKLAGPTGLYLLSRDTAETLNDLSVRMFFDALGAREDPATGSAAVCLARWLASSGYAPREPSPPLRVEQGYAQGRPSILHVAFGNDDGAAWVEVGGGVIVNVRGTLA